MQVIKSTFWLTFNVIYCYCIWLDPDTGLNLYQFIERHNYFYENHTIITEDDYILRTVRLPKTKLEAINVTTSKPVVLLLHGIWSNPGDLILNGDTSIGFMLVEAGFDVFLMASRGNTYSTKHKHLSTDSVAYWNFSWHEVGYYDIPSNIDYITNLTGVSELSFIGHSQGGTAFIAFAATRNDYLQKINSAHLFAPIVYMANTRIALINILAQTELFLNEAFIDLDLNKGIFTYDTTRIVYALGITLCHRDSLLISLCRDIFGLQGPDPLQLNISKITVLGSNDPAGGSFKQVVHYLQIAKSNKFRYYDYNNNDNNLAAYNQTTPPFYNLSSINGAPIHIWYGLNDYFAGALDYERIISEVPKAVRHVVSNPLWNHIDFAFAIEAPKYVYNTVIKDLLTYSNNYT